MQILTAEGKAALAAQGYDVSGLAVAPPGLNSTALTLGLLGGVGIAVYAGGARGAIPTVTSGEIGAAMNGYEFAAMQLSGHGVGIQGAVLSVAPRVPAWAGWLPAQKALDPTGAMMAAFNFGRAMSQVGNLLSSAARFGAIIAGIVATGHSAVEAEEDTGPLPANPIWGAPPAAFRFPHLGVGMGRGPGVGSGISIGLRSHGAANPTTQDVTINGIATSIGAVGTINSQVAAQHPTLDAAQTAALGGRIFNALRTGGPGTGPPGVGPAASNGAADVGLQAP